jgi:branched-chain amino acid transport system substrate-binding protein
MTRALSPIGAHRKATIMTRIKVLQLASLIIGAALSSTQAFAEKKYDPGASDSEIKIGQTLPYSGPASTYAVVGRVMLAYFKMLNTEQGGINGRKINLISLDDAYSPPKTVEQTRSLVEGEEVFAIATSVGSPTNLAVAKYLNGRKVPQILAAAGTPKLDNAAAYPWTTTFYASAFVETQIYAQYILKHKQDGKIAVLFQNDEYGRNYLAGLKKALGSKASMIVKELGYELTEPTIDSQMLTLKASGADILFLATTPKFSVQAIRKAHELSWTPMRIAVTSGAQIPTVFKPAGLDVSKDILTSQYSMLGGDPAWDDVSAMKEFSAFLVKWAPEARSDDVAVTYAYSAAQLLAEILKRCGDELTRDNLMRQATNINDYQLPIFIPGVKINVSPTSRIGWRQGQLMQFDGAKWIFVDEIVTVPESATRIDD